MDGYSTALLEAVERVAPTWIERSIAGVAQRQGVAVTVDAQSIASEDVRGLIDELRRLLEADVDQQQTTPLAIMRSAMATPTRILRDVGAAPVFRDDYQKQCFPDDIYGLIPANWGDIDESLVEPGLAWGAAKAMAHKERHEGR